MNLNPYDSWKEKRADSPKSRVSLATLLKKGEPFKISATKPKERWDSLDEMRHERYLKVRELILLCNGFQPHQRIEGSTFLIDHAHKFYWELRQGSKMFRYENFEFHYRHTDKIGLHPEYELEYPAADAIPALQSALQARGYAFEDGPWKNRTSDSSV